MEVTINNSNRVDSLWHSDDVANLVDDVVAMFVQNKTEQDVAFSGLAYVLNMMLAQVSAESGCRQARDLWENTKAVIDAQMMLCKGDA